MRAFIVVMVSLVAAAAVAAPTPKVVICHATHSAEHPYNRISVGPASMASHLAMHDGDFAWDPALHDDQCRAAAVADCGASQDTAARSCRAILDECDDRPRPDGVYWIDPSGSGAPFEAYCDMTRNHGGWMLIGKLGQDGRPTSDFRSDVGVPSLTSGPVPFADEYSHWDLARLDAYGSEWTVRVDTDVFNDLSHFQYTFYRPDTAVTLLPSTAGSSWKGAGTHSLLLHLTTSTTTGASNSTWLPVPDCIDGHCNGSFFLWTYRDPFGGGDCIDGADQTRLCHSVQGTVVSDYPVPGTMSAAYGMLDGVVHDWGKRATYWLRDTNAGGAP